jgi:hypothetical protein
MLEYKLYRLDGETRHIVSIKDVVARDDLDALQEAEKLCEAGAVEIWQGARCVARVKKDNVALDALDRRSL